MAKRALVCGAGGFIGGWLTRRLLDEGYEVRAADVKPLREWWQVHPDAENHDGCNLQRRTTCYWVCNGMDEVYDLAASMGGISFIEGNHFECAMNVLISAHMLQASIANKVKRFFFSSSACCYHRDRQLDPNITALREEDAYHNGGSAAEVGYGQEKLYTEWLCQYAMEDAGLETRIARFHNIMGPYQSWKDGREKAPAAICRKVATAKLTGDHRIKIWGSGEQSRSFCWIEDCVQGILDIMRGDNPAPVNLGSAEMVTINQLVDYVEDIAGIKLERRYNLDAPKGVAGRNSDNTEFKRRYGWEPKTSLRDGLAKTYSWIEEQVKNELHGDAASPAVEAERWGAEPDDALYHRPGGVLS